MKINIELPDNLIKDEPIYIVRMGADAELLAIKKPDSEKWLIKTFDCNKCGKCCYNTNERHPFSVDKETKKCMYLVAKQTENGFIYVCNLGIHIPLACLLGFHEPQDKPDFCTETFKEV